MKRIVLFVVVAGAWGVGAQRPAPPARMTLSVGGPAGGQRPSRTLAPSHP
jgi:hypothetical protein